MEILSVLAFAGVAFSLIVVPGPDWAYVLAAGLRDRVVIPAVGGLMLGYLVLTIVIAAGVGPLVAAVPWALTSLTLGGAAYLVFLGVSTLRRPSSIPASGAVPVPPRSMRRLLIRGVGVSALNPKGLLVFLAILPQFARPDIWPLPAQLAVLGLTFVGICGLVYSALGFTANRILRARPGLGHVITRVAGVAMIVVGLALAVERVVTVARGL